MCFKFGYYCNTSQLVKNSISYQATGIVFGSVAVGQLSDIFGRKPVRFTTYCCSLNIILKLSNFIYEEIIVTITQNFIKTFWWNVSNKVSKQILFLIFCSIKLLFNKKNSFWILILRKFNMSTRKEFLQCLIACLIGTAIANLLSSFANSLSILTILRAIGLFFTGGQIAWVLAMLQLFDSVKKLSWSIDDSDSLKVH